METRAAEPFSEFCRAIIPEAVLHHLGDGRKRAAGDPLHEWEAEPGLVALVEIVQPAGRRQVGRAVSSLLGPRQRAARLEHRWILPQARVGSEHLRSEVIRACRQLGLDLVDQLTPGGEPAAHEPGYQRPGVLP